MTRDFAHAFIATNGPLMAEAIETIIGKRPETPNPNDATRSLGWYESESKRSELAGSAELLRAERESSGTSVGLPLENGVECAPAPTLVPHNVFGDPTPPLNTTGSDYAEDDWQSLLTDTEN